MRSKCLRIAAALTLVFGLFPVSQVLAGGDDNEVKFKGFIESLPSAGLIGNWVVSGTTVRVTDATRIEQEDGRAAVGAVVKVEGRRRSDGSVDATEVEVKEPASGGGNDDDDRGEAEFKGTLESFPSGFVGDWRVSGRAVHVTDATIIDREHGAVVVGAFVEVKGTMRADGSIDATRIEVKTGMGDREGENTNFKGNIDALPAGSDLMGDWIIDGRRVHVLSSTRLKAGHGAFTVGTRVKVKGIQLANGAVVATRIQVKD